MSAPAVEVQHLTFAHDKTRHQLLDVSLCIDVGQVCCLLGPNGTGKTTLLRCLLGLLRAESGSVRVAGRELSTMSNIERARHVAYVPQSTATAFPFSALDIAVMGRTPHLLRAATPSRTDRLLAVQALDRLGVGHLADRSFTSLSGGERQLVLFARALVQESPVLVLDEPTAALDYGNAVRILHLVRELSRDGRTVLMSTHQPDHAFACGDRAVLLSGGHVVADGPPAQVVTGGRLSQLYGVRVHVVPTDLHDGEGRALSACLATDGPTDPPTPARDLAVGTRPRREADEPARPTEPAAGADVRHEEPALAALPTAAGPPAVRP